MACPTSLALVLVRTELLGPDDLPNVLALQDLMRVEPLSAARGEPRPSAPALTLGEVPVVDVRKPLDEGFLRVLAAMLSQMPVLPADSSVRWVLAAIGVAGTASGAATLDALLADPIRDGSWTAPPVEPLPVWLQRAARNRLQAVASPGSHAWIGSRRGSRLILSRGTHRPIRINRGEGVLPDA